MDRYEIDLYTKNISYYECLKGAPLDIMQMVDPLPMTEKFVDNVAEMVCSNLPRDISLDKSMTSWITYFLRVSALKNNHRIRFYVSNNDYPSYELEYDNALDDAYAMIKVIVRKIQIGRFLRKGLPSIAMFIAIFSAIFILITHI